MHFVFRTQSTNHPNNSHHCTFSLIAQTLYKCYINAIFYRHITQNTHPGPGWVSYQKNITYKQYKQVASDTALSTTLITFLQNLSTMPSTANATMSISSSQKCVSINNHTLCQLIGSFSNTPLILFVIIRQISGILRILSWILRGRSLPNCCALR